jgi:hypothetical protein
MKSFLKTLLAFTMASSLLLSAVSAQVANPPSTNYAYGPDRTIIYPNTAGLSGSYQKTLVSGTMAAGLAANAPIFSFRYGGSGNAVIKAVRISAANQGTAFAAGSSSHAMYVARAFTASDSGGTAGTLTGNNGDLRTAFPTTAVSDFRIASTATLTAGTRTLDTDPIAALVNGIQATAGSSITPGTQALFYPQNAGDYPLVLVQNEGFVIQATVPATGTWTFQVTVEWDEYSPSY